ncbi:MAG: MlaE family lipid ABC transporter permease subunit [Sphingopyxis sp.]
MTMLAADFTLEGSGPDAILRLQGRFTLARIGGVHGRLQAAVAENGSQLAAIDLSALERMDTVGAWVVSRLMSVTGARLAGASAEAARLISAVGDADQPVQIREEAPSALVRAVEGVGRGTRIALGELMGLTAFFGATLVSFFTLLRNPRHIRWHAVITRFEAVGVNALGIVGLMCFLIGIVIAQQGATQLRQFGMEIFTVNLVGRSAIRELGLLMTAIMVAGRSGSAFAAQIGTMKLTEEIDALRTIGVSPMEALVVPRVLATTLMMPLLGFYAGVVAIVGGGVFCWFGLDIPPLTYVQRLREIIPMTDLWAMLIKGPVFGMIIAVAGCYHGMQVKANAEEVGLRTTAAVVQGIFLVIVLDAFFAVFFTSIGWQ